jgi:hypothetical protein
VPQQASCEPKRRGLESAEGIFPRPAQVPKSFILTHGNIDRSQVPRAHQACQFERIPAVGLDAISGLLGEQGGRHDPADLALGGQIALEPIATRPRCRDKDEVGAFGLQPANKFIDIALARPDVPKADDLGVRCVGDVGDGKGLFMHISPDVEGARLVHG